MDLIFPPPPRHVRQLLKETKVLTKKFTSNDSDIIISKAKAASGRKSSRKLDFDEFVHCLELIAAQKGVDAEKIYEKLLSSSASDNSPPPPTSLRPIHFLVQGH